MKHARKDHPFTRIHPLARFNIPFAIDKKTLHGREQLVERLFVGWLYFFSYPSAKSRHLPKTSPVATYSYVGISKRIGFSLR